MSIIRARRLIIPAILSCFVGVGSAAAAPPGDIVVTTTIQAAVDAADPGDTIFVPPGVYHETVTVTDDGITIRGSHAAILDATGFAVGIRVGTGSITRPGGVPTCPPLAVEGFTLSGLTVRNASAIGVRLIGVDGFRLTATRYLHNVQYGPFPICSRDGLVDHNFASGHPEDAAIYVGDSEDVVVEKNRVVDSLIGVEVENSVAVRVQRNELVSNTSGILLVALPGLPIPLLENIQVEDNVVVKNNLPNQVPPDSGDVVGLIPTGSGILNVGGDDVLIEGNVVIGNDSVGVGMIQNPFAAADPRLEPNPDGNEIRRNRILNNGLNPDPLRAVTPGADIVYDGSGTGNCFEDNVFKTEFPPGITALFPCA